MVSLYNPEFSNYRNNDTKAYIVDGDMGFAVDHYGAEM
jgi:hypothetical protein